MAAGLGSGWFEGSKEYMPVSEKARHMFLFRDR